MRLAWTVGRWRPRSPRRSRHDRGECSCFVTEDTIASAYSPFTVRSFTHFRPFSIGAIRFSLFHTR